MSFDKEQFKQELNEQVKEAVSLVFESKIKEKMAEEDENLESEDDVEEGKKGKK